MLTELLLLFLTKLILYFIYLHKKIHYKFSKYGIKYLPGVPLFGNQFKSVMGFKNIMEVIDEIYTTFPDERYIGFIEGTTPIILIKDPEIAKLILLKNSDNFFGHQFLGTSRGADSMFAETIFMMPNEKWRRMRSLLSPAFTAAKMKKNFPLIQKSIDKVMEFLNENINQEINSKDVIERFACDYLSATCFGLEMNSLKDRDNKFFDMGKAMLQVPITKNFLLLLENTFPGFFKTFGIELFSKDFKSYLLQIMKETIEHRKINKTMRSDVIQLLVEASNDWTLFELGAQLLFYYIAGYLSVSANIAMVVYEIISQPDIQEKLYQEIIEHKKNNVEFTLDSLNELKYLDAVYNETLRKWTGAVVLDRICSKPFELPPSSPGGKPYLLKPGDVIYYPINSVMRDPKYYPDPDNFDPERFLDERKSKVTPYTFAPFGMGKRSCLGEKFVEVQFKVFMYNVIPKFKLIKSDVKATMELDPTDIIPVPKNGVMVKVAVRD